MTQTHVEDAHPSVVAEADKGPHKGWSYFDSKLEGARFHLLHGVVSQDPFDPAAAGRLADELESLSQSYGYGSADSYLVDTAGMSDDDVSSDVPLSVQKANLFDDDGEEDPYFIEVRNSERIMLEAAATPEAREFLGAGDHGADWKGAWGPMHSRMKAAFCRGRDMRAEQTFSAPAP